MFVRRSGIGSTGSERSLAEMSLQKAFAAQPVTLGAKHIARALGFARACHISTNVAETRAASPALAHSP
eukprot:13860680-Alexandrium_andersonii.AAC.1